jgi:hypothetical protein
MMPLIEDFKMKDVTITFCDSNGYMGINGGGPNQCSASLHTFHTSSAVLDYVAQVGKKPWVSDAKLGELFRQIDEHLGFQENFCSFGKEAPPKTQDQLVRIIHQRSKNADSQHWRLYREIQQRASEFDRILENESETARKEARVLVEEMLNSLWNSESWKEI